MALLECAGEGGFHRQRALRPTGCARLYHTHYQFRIRRQSGRLLQECLLLQHHARSGLHLPHAIAGQSGGRRTRKTGTRQGSLTDAENAYEDRHLYTSISC